MTGDIVYTYRGSWCAEGLSTTWEADWRVIGAEGSVRWSGGDDLAVEVVAERGGFRSQMIAVEAPPYDGTAKIGGHAGCIADFVRCIREDDLPETLCTDNVKSLAMVFGAIESAKRGERVAIHPEIA
jgi:predicted dehydrogenase